MAYRSESNTIGNKPDYQDLNLTHYPSNLDTRLNNKNMKGFVNIGEGQIPDYVMAEYMNAVGDAVMAIERALGLKPMVPYGTNSGDISTIVSSSNVSSRIARIENGLFDERYGGSSWVYNAGRPTLSKHSHNGLNGHPNKISLKSEVSDLLGKTNIDLTSATGMTGSDIFISKVNPTPISDALGDFLSKSVGGIVRGPVSFEAPTQSKTHREFDHSNLKTQTGVSETTDHLASGKKAIRFNDTTLSSIVLSNGMPNLFYGKYILGVRLKCSDFTYSSKIITLSYGNDRIDIKGTDFNSNTEYRMFYMLINHDETNENTKLMIEKATTTKSVSILFDSAFLEPAHPAVLDR